MSTYAIGDLQGCAGSFDVLLERIAFDRRADRLWLVGDLVNRGPDSLGVLRRMVELGDAATVVLGNHDLHLLAIWGGARKAGRHDTLDALLAAPDAGDLLDWLRHRPLAHRETIANRIESLPDFDALMVHAGVLPSWTVADTLRYAGELEAALRGDGWRRMLAELFGNRPDRWSEDLEGRERLRAIVNALTRVRFCSQDDRIDFDAKDAPGVHSGPFPPPPTGFAPWFDQPGRRTRDALLVVGHWSTLGVVVRDDLVALDSGCVWGGALTAVRLEDRALLQVPCPAAQEHA